MDEIAEVKAALSSEDGPNSFASGALLAMWLKNLAAAAGDAAP